MNPKVYIILLNYNDWSDTIMCLESIFRLDYSCYQVIVVDNGSVDRSMDKIIDWAEGKLEVDFNPDDPLKDLYYPSISKPIEYSFYERKDIEDEKIKEDNVPLILIQTGENLGYAGGNNVGIKYALLRDAFDYLWILNSDTLVGKDSLKSLVFQAESYKKEKKKIGIIGSKLLYYHNPKVLQGIGGEYNKIFGLSKHIGGFEEDKGQYDREDIKIDYCIGASILVSKEFIEDVGLMDEAYFLYFEDLDWAERGKRKGYEAAYCWESKVYHKEGGSIGSSSKGKEKSELADFYGLRNRILFTRKFYPQFLLTVYLGYVGVILNRIKRGQFNRVKLVFKAIFDAHNVSL